LSKSLYNEPLLLTPWSRVLLEQLTGSQLVKKFPEFVETKGSLPHSQEPATIPYPEQARSSPCSHIPLPEDGETLYKCLSGRNRILGMDTDNFLLQPEVEFCDLPCHSQLGSDEKIHHFKLYPTNAPDPFKSVSYERSKWVRCGHLNAPHSHV